jgi:hypothetical protein
VGDVLMDHEEEEIKDSKHHEDFKMPCQSCFRKGYTRRKIGVPKWYDAMLEKAIILVNNAREFME